MSEQNKRTSTPEFKREAVRNDGVVMKKIHLEVLHEGEH
jgi:hypothetical protein